MYLLIAVLSVVPSFRLLLGCTAYSAPPDPLAAFKRPTSKGRGRGKGRVGRERAGEGEGQGRRGKGPHTNAGTWAPSYLATLLP